MWVYKDQNIDLLTNNVVLNSNHCQGIDIMESQSVKPQNKSPSTLLPLSGLNYVLSKVPINPLQ